MLAEIAGAAVWATIHSPHGMIFASRDFILDLTLDERAFTA
jgi:hypothetical protein